MPIRIRPRTKLVEKVKPTSEAIPKPVRKKKEWWYPKPKR